MLTKDQIEARRGKLFATDAPAALGVSRYKTPYRLWLEKTGRVEEASAEDERLIIGQLMEPVIAQLYTIKTGIEVYPYKETEMHDTIPWMGSHFDYRAADRLVEIKNFSAARRREFGDAGSDDVPADVKVQVVHEMVVSNVPKCDVAVLFGGQVLEVYTVALTDADADELIERESAFMRHITDDVPPAPVSHEDVAAMYRSDTQTVVTATREIEEAVAERRIIAERISSLEEMLESIDVKIKAFMADASVLCDKDGETLATWRTPKPARVFDVKAFQCAYPDLYEAFVIERQGSRRFLIKEVKDDAAKG